MLAEERREKIMEILKNKGNISISELCNDTGASVATIRRDLSRMENRGLLVKIHGGAMLSNRNRFELSFEKRALINIEKKKMIAVKVMATIQEGDTVLLDAGTTTFFIAKEIGKSKKKVSVFTNSLAIAQEVANYPNIYLTLIGGRIDWKNMATIGSMTAKYLMDLIVDKAFIGANAVDVEHGAMTIEEDNAFLNHLMLKSAHHIFVVADSSKIGKSAFFGSVPIESMNFLVTDNGADREIIETLESKGVRVLFGGE